MAYMSTAVENFLIDVASSRACANIGHMIFGYGIPIFMLHRMCSSADTLQTTSAISDMHLRQCLSYLADNHFTFLSLRELLTLLAKHQSPPKKSIVFTIDDGFEDQASIAAPIFLEYNCPVTIFLITGMLDQQLWPWDDQVAYLINTTTEDYLDFNLKNENYHFELTSPQKRKTARVTLRNAIKSVPFNKLESILEQLQLATKVNIPVSPPPKYKPMTWELARQFEKQGIEFAPHTISHRILSRLDSESMKVEILGSWQRIQDELTSPSPIFCYPTGRYCDFGAREIKLIRESGFIGGVSTIPAQVRTNLVNDYYLYGLPRYPLPESFHEFKLYCSWIEYAKERNLRFWPR